MFIFISLDTLENLGSLYRKHLKNSFLKNDLNQVISQEKVLIMHIKNFTNLYENVKNFYENTLLK